jgi:hypothetical protein
MTGIKYGNFAVNSRNSFAERANLFNSTVGVPVVARRFGCSGRISTFKGYNPEQRASSKNLWNNPQPASEELKLTVAEFKDKYDRSEPWNGDFAA